MGRIMKQQDNRMLLEELIACFPLYDTAYGATCLSKLLGFKTLAIVWYSGT
jgi:hypothetical protein